MLYQVSVFPSIIDPAGECGEPGSVALREIGPDIGRRLKEARETRGLTVRELADRANTTKTTIHTVASGDGAKSSLLLLMQIARALRVSPEWLIFGLGDGPESSEK